MNLIQQIINGKVPYGIWGPDGSINKCPVKRSPVHIFSGSFNPLHDAHKAYSKYVRDTFGEYLYYELSVRRIDKEILNEQEILRRIRQFTWFAPIIITNAPLFFDKGKLFPYANFHMGYDSAERLLKMHSIEEIESQPNMYYVHNRAGQSLADIPIEYVPANMYVLHSNFPPISSTEIRSRVIK